MISKRGIGWLSIAAFAFAWAMKLSGHMNVAMSLLLVGNAGMIWAYRNIGWIVLAVGGLSNALAVFANNGIMPVLADICKDNEDLIHRCVLSARLQYLCDVIPLSADSRCSVGDLFCFGAIILFAIDLARRRHKTSGA